MLSLKRQNPNVLRPDTAVKIHGCFGLGDTIYLRQLVEPWAKTREPGATIVHTSWPQLWQGSGLPLIPSGTHFRTQRENELRNLHLYDSDLSQGRRLCVGYNFEYFASGEKSIVDALAGAIQFSLPDTLERSFTVPDSWRWAREDASFGYSRWTKDKFIIESLKPLAFVRPPTIRREWMAPGRNPDAQAFGECVKYLRQNYHVISVASAIEPHEQIVDPIEADTRFERGELDFEPMFGLLASSDVALGGVGFLLPAALCHNVKTVILAGGSLSSNGPRAVMPRQLDWSNVKMILPDEGEQCWCTQYRHNCKRKTDPNRAIEEMRQHFTTTQREAA